MPAFLCLNLGGDFLTYLTLITDCGPLRNEAIRSVTSKPERLLISNMYYAGKEDTQNKSEFFSRRGGSFSTLIQEAESFLTLEKKRSYEGVFL